MSPDERKTLHRIHHDADNALATARANLEAIVDGVLDPSPERLVAIVESLNRASEILKDLSHL